MKSIKTILGTMFVAFAVTAATPAIAQQPGNISRLHKCTVNVENAIRNAPGGYKSLRKPMYCRFVRRIGQTPYTLWVFQGPTYSGQVRIKRFSCGGTQPGSTYSCYDGRVIVFFGKKSG